MLLGLGIFPIILKFGMYLGGIVAALLAMTWKPRIGLYFLIPLLPLQTTRYKIHDLPGGDKLVLVLLLSVIIGLLVRGKPIIPRKCPLKFTIILFSAYTFLTLWTGSIRQDLPLPVHFYDVRLQEWLNYLLMPLIYLLTISAVNNEKQIRLLLLLMCFSLAVVTRSFGSSMAGRDLSNFSDNIRDAGPLGFAGENGLGAYEAQMSLFLLGLYAYEKRYRAKLVMLALLACNMYCLLFAFSRGAYLAFAMGLLVLGLLRERKYLVLLVVLLVGYQTIIPSSVRQRVAMTVDQSGNLESSAGDRVRIWQDAVELIQESPIIGSGFATYQFMSRVGVYKDTHNMYLKVLVENGVIGIGLFLSMLVGLLGLGFRTFRANSDPFVKSMGLGLTAMMISVLVVNLFGDRWSYLQVNGVLWTLAGCVVRGNVLAQEAALEDEQFHGMTLDSGNSVDQIPESMLRA